MKIVSAIPATLPAIPSVSESGHLANFSNAYAVAVRLKETTGAVQYVVSTRNPDQPFRILAAPPADPCRIVSTIA